VQILSIDPGVAGTGVAVWSRIAWGHGKPTDVFNLYPRKDAGRDFTSKTCSLLKRLEESVDLKEVTEVWCEMPEFFQSAGGMMVASSGDLSKLTFMVGALAGHLWKYGIVFKTVCPTVWKGQLTKDMVIRKIQHIIPDIEKSMDPKSHSWDAIGIGLWAQNRFKR